MQFFELTIDKVTINVGVNTIEWILFSLSSAKNSCKTNGLIKWTILVHWICLRSLYYVVCCLALLRNSATLPKNNSEISLQVNDTP
jgi:hypothetical protein